MKRSSGPRKTANLSESVHQQLTMYMIAAGAAGVGILTFAQPAEAKIVYTQANVRIGITGVRSYNLDLNNDGITDVTIQFSTRSVTCGLGRHGGRANISETPALKNAIEGLPVLALSAGAVIGKRQVFAGVQQYMDWLTTGRCYGHGGNWWDATDRYLGVRFKIQGKNHFGWARLTSQRGRFGLFAMLTGYAYETVVGKSIIAGKTHGRADDSTLNPDSTNPDDPGPGASLTSPIPTPQPASLGLLALGAQGVPVWRRKETQEVIGQ
jgi:hypothetical protein